MSEQDSLNHIQGQLNESILESLENILKALAILTDELALIKSKVNQ